MSFIPKWTAANIALNLDTFEKATKKQMVDALHYIGNEFIEKARNNGNYTDRTGNLRSSIGYAIFKNGIEVGSKFEIANEDENSEGVNAGKSAAKSISKTGFALVVVAGMEYAIAVESRGKNVLTLFAPTMGEVSEDLNKLLKDVG